MIRIKVTEKDISIQGHAHDGNGGLLKREIEACAAITALCHQFLYSVHVMSPEDYKAILFSSGYFIFNRSNCTVITGILSEALVIGARAVQSAYRECVDFQDLRN